MKNKKRRSLIAQPNGMRVMPIAAFVVLPALAVRLKFLEVAPDAAFLWPDCFVGDVRSWWKAVFVLGTGLWMGVHILVSPAAGWRPEKRFLSAVAFATTAVVLSALFSDFSRTSWMGYTAQYEGGLALVAYLVGLWYAAELVDPGARLILVRLVGGVAMLNGALGTAEGLGVDILRPSIVQWLMNAPEGSLRRNFLGTGMAGGTLFQPNHFGMFMAMAAVLALAMTFREKSRFWRCFWLATFLLGVPSCVFSRSRAAVLVCAFMILVALAFMAVEAIRRRDDRGQWLARHRLGIALFAAAAIAVTAFSASRMGDALRDALASMGARGFWSLGPAVQTPVRAVSLREGEIRVQWGEGDLSIGRDPEGDWTLAASGSGDVPKRMRPTAGGNAWNRQPLPGLEEHEFRFRRDGNASLSGPGFDLDFYAVDAAVFAVDYNNRLWDRIEPAPSIGFAGFEGLFSGRGYIWSRSLPLIAENPVLGSGPGTFALVFPNADLFANQVYFQNRDEDKAHGIWLSLLVQLGIIGTAAFVFPFGLAFYRGMKNRDALSAPLLLAATAFVLGLITNDSTVGTSPIFCVILGLAASGHAGDAPSAEDAAG